MMTLEEYFTVPDYLEEDFNNILYVDDEDSNLRVFDSVFSRYYNVYTANNGAKAIDMLREFDIHMIITDQKMPEMTGTDLLEKTLEEFPDIIRIILTGFADIQAIIKAINKCSIYKYITKPYENSEIREVIDKGLEIYNMRMKKYQNEANEVGTGVTSEHDSNDNVVSGIDSEILNFALPMIQDIRPVEEDYQGYFDFHIQYQLMEEGLPSMYSDFVVHSDEEGSRLFHISMKTSPDLGGAMAYMHMKSKLRSLIEIDGTATKLPDLLAELTSLYDAQEVAFRPEDIQMVSYHWDTGELQYLSKEKDIKAYSISEKLEVLNLKKSKVSKTDYSLYKAQSEDNLMIYFWNYQLSAEGDEKESGEYIKQIISHVTSVPFDMQVSQISRGVKSVAKHFNDAMVFGLYLSE